MKRKTNYFPFIGLGILAILGNILQKCLNTTMATGRPDQPPHHFHKPWFNTLNMFIAELLSIIVFLFQNVGTHGLKKHLRIPFRHFCFFALPALCDLLMTVMHIISFIYLGVSVSVVIGFCRILFSALISRFILKEKLRNYQFLAIFLIILSFICVSIAIKNGSGSPPVESTTTVRFVAVAFKFAGYILDAAKSAFEQHILHQMKIDSTLLVSIEGFWGLLATLFIFIPIVSHSTSFTFLGFSEDFTDTFAMLSNSSFLQACVIIDLIFILLLNIFSMYAIEFTSALYEKLFSSIQGAAVWISQIILYYSFKGTKYDDLKRLGEQWTQWSILQLVGFIIAIYAMFIYNGIIKFKCFQYEKQYDQLKNPEVDVL